MNDARHVLEDGPDIVRLNLTHVLMSDMGVWRCNVTVESEMHVQSGGKLVPLGATTVGSISVNIQLIIVSKLTIN